MAWWGPRVVRRCEGPRQKFLSKGFTLLDLLMVILILGIMAVAAIPRFESMLSASRLNSAASELYSGLAYAEIMAVKYQRPFGVKADVGGNWFRVFDARYKADPNPHHGEDPLVDAYGVVLNPVDKEWYQVDYDTADAYRGVQITAVPPGGEISFYPDGHSSAGSASFVLGLAGEQRTVTVNGTTGAITVQ